MQSYDIPMLPWSKVSVDIFGLDGKQYLVTVDHYSEFFEIDSLQTTHTSTVIRAMKKNVARFSNIPHECLSDNGPQFDSHEKALGNGDEEVEKRVGGIACQKPNCTDEIIHPLDMKIHPGSHRCCFAFNMVSCEFK
jgi:hypothetical protein